MAFKKLKYWFDETLANTLAEKIKAEYPSFQSKKFVQSVCQQLDPLELKDRVAVFAQQLQVYLPQDYREALPILLAILGPVNEKETGMFTEGYWIMPIAKFVEDYGLAHFQASMRAIKEITMRNTSEYTIRPYLVQYPDKTFRQMQKWAKDKNAHVRRLASEGLRPRLPWAKKLQGYIDDPSHVLVVLELLKNDPSRYVQKSVANALNDILKDNYEIGMQTIKSWANHPEAATKWIIKHALRNQRKQENPEALAILDQL